MDQPKTGRTRMGRPPLPRNQVRVERVVSFLTADQKQQLQAFARESEQSLSTAAQDLIQRSLGQEFSDTTDNTKENS